MTNALQSLRERLAEINDISGAAALLYWDQATYMPAGGAAARGRQLATLRKLAHEKLIAPETGNLIERAALETKDLSADSFAASLVRVARREFERAVKVPATFMARFSEHTSKTYEAWAAAREKQHDFAEMIPYLEKTLELSREYAAFFPKAAHPADPLIDLADEGFTAATVKILFANLRTELLTLVKQIAERPKPSLDPLRGYFELPRQIAFGEEVIRKMGYDFSRGRQDMTRHPFMIKFSLGDVRITTRAKEDDVTDSLFSTIHEAGHAMYEQGVDAAFEATPMASGVSAAVHESQSRLWENLVGRSRDFWQHYFPKLVASFPEPLAKVSFDAFYRAINRVEPSLIRTDADEVTYNLHVMIRFDLECALLEGKLAVKDLRDAWNARYHSDLGIAVPHDLQGVLQDVHWYTDFIGGQFQCYAIGNILSAQFFDAALHAHPQIREEIRAGEFKTLLGWLRQNVHRYGKQYFSEEVVLKATGQPMTTAPYLRYLKNKYGELYGLAG